MRNPFVYEKDKAVKYYYANAQNQATGPVSLDELKKLQQSGVLNPESLVIEEGGTEWKPLKSLSTDSNPVQPVPQPEASQKPVSAGMAAIWFVCCLPIGFMTWGQTAKGWVWVLVSIVTGGVGGIAAIIDYWMCFSVQRVRKLRDWEIFPCE